MISRKALAATATLLLVITAGCSSTPEDKPSGSPGRTAAPGSTTIRGGPMEQLPVPASPKIPASQQEAQDTVLAYLQKTLDALPRGTSLDGTRYMVGSGTTYCEDEPSGPDAPVHFEDWRDMVLPAGITTAQIVIKTGEIWIGWGWQVIERDGFVKPNRFGYAPDGYVLQIEARTDPNVPPSLIGSSPCYPGNLRRDDIPRPPVITQRGSQTPP